MILYSSILLIWQILFFFFFEENLANLVKGLILLFSLFQKLVELLNIILAFKVKQWRLK